MQLSGQCSNRGAGLPLDTLGEARWDKVSITTLLDTDIETGLLSIAKGAFFLTMRLLYYVRTPEDTRPDEDCDSERNGC